MRFPSAKAKAFVKHFNPYRGKYVMQGMSPLFDEPYWFHEEKQLTSGLIAKAILEQLVVGWFTTHVPNCLGVDLDDHRGKAWTGQQAPSAYLLNVYRQVTERIGRPSLLIQSPHGLHGYWMLTERVPAAILYEQASKKLGGLPVEIKPTPTTALRIPTERRLLDPVTFQLLNQQFETVVENMPVYHPVLVFNTIPEDIRETLQTKRQKLRSFRALGRIEKAEQAVHFYDGASNDAFLELCNVYRCAGLSEEDALYRFQVKLEQSPLYDGELKHKPRRLLQRICSEYKRNPYNPQPRQEVQLSLFNQFIVDELSSRHPFARQRTQPVRRFIEKILLWADWHDDILQDPGKTAVFDYLYRYYRKNRRAGYYPLPRSLLKKTNSHYETLMPWLESEGFIEPAPYKYSAMQNICRYYKVHREGFLMKVIHRRAGDFGVRASSPL